MSRPAELLKLRQRFYDPIGLVSAYLPSFNGGGLFLRTSNPLELLTRFELTFNLPPEDEFITCQVEVLWVNLGRDDPQRGMGVRLVDLSPEDRGKLDDFLKQWARQDALLGERYRRILPLESDPTGSQGP